MRIVTLSDTHSSHHKLTIPDGDLILHSGDSTYNGTLDEIEVFLRWYGGLDHDMKVLIAGNHDWGFEKDPKVFEEMCENYGVTYLNDSGCKFKGLNIWGSPVQPEFFNWAFNRARTPEEADPNNPMYVGHSYIGDHWDKIPKKTDILLTHGPPGNILDRVQMPHSMNYGDNVGCDILADKVKDIKPVLHVFGHIHEQRGVKVVNIDGSPITYVNSSSLNAKYKPWGGKEFSFDWDKLLIGKSFGDD